MKQLLLLMLLPALSARADYCADSQALANNGQAGLVSFSMGKAMAEKLCGNIVKETNPDPQMVQQCQQLGQLDANARLQDANVQSALDQFEKTFGIPKDDFLQALAHGHLRDLMAGKLSEGQLDSALAKGDAAAPATATAASVDSSLSGAQERGPSSSRLRDKLRDKLKDKLADKAVVSHSADDHPNFDGLTPSPGMFATEPDKELTIFEVVHIRYKALTPRMRPGKSLAP